MFVLRVTGRTTEQSSRVADQVLVAVARRRAHPTGNGELIHVRFTGQPFGVVIKGVTVASVGAGSVAALVARPGDIVDAINDVETTAASAGANTVKQVRVPSPALRCQM